MWKELYWEWMFPKNNEDVNFAKALILKSQKIPMGLFKYGKANEYTKENILNDVIWCSRADLFNDPFDSAVTKNISVHQNKIKETVVREFCRSFKLNFEEVLEIVKPLNLELTQEALINTLKVSGVNISQRDIESIKNKIQELYDETFDIFENHVLEINAFYQKRIYASCFSEDPLSTLMWSHYADNNKGICLEYDFSELDIFDDNFKNIHPVKYTDSLIDLTELDGSNNIRKTLLASLNKTKDWQYEKEWRIVLDDTGETDEGIKVKLFKPKYIILGSRISDSDKEDILKITREKEILVKQLKEDRINNKLILAEMN